MPSYNEPDTIIKTAEIARRAGVSISTVLRWEKSGFIPKRIKLGQRTRGLPLSTFNAWLQSQTTPTPNAQ